MPPGGRGRGINTHLSFGAELHRDEVTLGLNAMQAGANGGAAPA